MICIFWHLIWCGEDNEYEFQVKICMCGNSLPLKFKYISIEFDVPKFYNYLKFKSGFNIQNNPFNCVCV